jgi:BirA family biotin operon repressor/biotin-[acetyl-CoA-carboxylase] ligase
MLAAVVWVELLSEQLATSKVEVKWPNDIYVDDKKIAGILIETSFQAKRLDAVWMGIGLNVNQRHFALSHGTSLEIITGREWSRDTLLENFLLGIEAHFSTLSRATILYEHYGSKLRWRDEWHSFRCPSGIFEGKISGVDAHGRLQVLTGNETRVFDVKEIEFLH